MLICVAEKFIVGGIETYYMRMFQWAKKAGKSIALFLPEGSQIAEEWHGKICELDLKVYFYSETIKKVYVNHSDEISDIDYFANLHKTIISDNLHTYIAAKQIANQHKWTNYNLLLYILHPEMSRCSENKIFNIGYKYLLVKKILDSSFVFMDEQTRNSFQKYYNYTVPSNVPILRIGQNIPLQKPEITERKKDKFVILSICRMNFPFKGYVLGLIDTYIELKKQYKSISLELVGDGPGMQQVQQKLAELGSSAKDITLKKTVKYEALSEHIKNCDIYVGMGTTLLDAGKYGRIGVIAVANQYAPISPGYFFENSEMVAIFPNEQGFDKYSLKELIEKVLCADDIQLNKWSQQSFEMVREYYNIDTIMDTLCNMKTDVHISHFKWSVIKFYNYLILQLKNLVR